jgi:hypothetical protein
MSEPLRAIAGVFSTIALCVALGCGPAADSPAPTSTMTGGGTSTPASFTVTAMMVVPDQTDYVMGQWLQVRALVRNDGAEAATYRGVLTINGEAGPGADTRIEPGRSVEVSFDVRCGPAGMYELALDGEATVIRVVAQPLQTPTPRPTRTPRPTSTPTPTSTPAPAAMDVTDLSVDPSNPGPGDDLFVTVAVSNTGGDVGTTDVSLLVDGSVFETQRVSCSAGQTARALFFVPALGAGRHVLSVGDLKHEFGAVAGARPVNGKVFVNRVKGGLGHLTVENGNERDAFVALARASDPSTTVLSFYVRSDKSVTIKRIKNGTYVLYFSLGSGWDASSRSFIDDAAYRRMDDELRYTTTRVSGGTRFTIFRVTLHPVPGGSVPIDFIDESDFPTP